MENSNILYECHKFCPNLSFRLNVSCNIAFVSLLIRLLVSVRVVLRSDTIFSIRWSVMHSIKLIFLRHRVWRRCFLLPGNCVKCLLHKLVDYLSMTVSRRKVWIMFHSFQRFYFAVVIQPERRKGLSLFCNVCNKPTSITVAWILISWCSRVFFRKGIITKTV